MVFGVVVLAGCEHTSPFGAEPAHEGMHELFPEQMTLSSGLDALQGLSYSGDEIFYTFCDDLKVERVPACGVPAGNPSSGGDRCLGALSIGGGGRLVSRCVGPGGDKDSVQVYTTGTRLADGSIWFVYQSRVWSSGMFLNAGLYRLTSGELKPQLILSYEPDLGNTATPGRMLSAGENRIYAESEEGAALLEMGSDGVISIPAPRFIAIDPRLELGLLIRDEQLIVRQLRSGTETAVGPIPSTEWREPQLTGVGFAGGSIVVSQRGQTGSEIFPVHNSRLVLLRTDQQPVVFAERTGSAWSTVVVSADEQFAVAQLGGDIYRIALP